MDQNILWSPIVDPAVVLLAQCPRFIPDVPAVALEGSIELRESAEGAHAARGPISSSTQLLFLPGAYPDAPLAAVIPLDADMVGRVEALTRFWRSTQGRPAIPDTRITSQQRARLRAMMLAADGRANGASYRDVAMVLYGHKRIASESWKTSALRDRVIST